MLCPRSFRPSFSPLSVVAAALLGTLSATGCGDSDGVETLKTYPVQGSVRLDGGKPLESGVVVFSLPEKGLEFSSPVGPDGSFALKSPYGDGAPEGSYRVRIERDPAKAESQVKGGRKSASPTPYPAKYADESTSGLSAVVKPSDNALEPFVLAR